MTLTPETIAHLRGLLEKATKGPWSSTDFEIYPSEIAGHDGGCDDSDDAPLQAARLHACDEECTAIRHAKTAIADVYGLQEFASADGALIVAAINALPSLLDEIERLHAERDRYRKALEEIVYQRDEAGGDHCDECLCSLYDKPPKHYPGCSMLSIRAALEGK